MIFLWDNIKSLFKRGATGKTAAPNSVSGKRSWLAARPSRFFKPSAMIRSNINKELKGDLAAVRASTREAEQNNSYVSGALDLFETHIVGPEGFTFQSQMRKGDGSLDEKRNNVVEDGFRIWQEPEFCTMQGNLHFVELQWLWVKELKRDGEIFHLIVPNAKNDFGFAFELMGPDYLDETYDDEFRNGNAVINGVEVNEWKRPVAYWIRKSTSKHASLYLHDRERISAENVLHGFKFSHPNQTRGMSKFATTLIELYKLDKFEDAGLDKALVNAYTGGFTSSTPENFSQYGGADIKQQNDPEHKEEEKDEVFELESGVYVDLGAQRFIPFDPKFPYELYDTWKTEEGRKIATGLGMNYNVLFNNLRDLNFVSLRFGWNNAMDEFIKDQTLMKVIALNKFPKRWLKWAVLNKQVNLPFDLIEKKFRWEWQGRRWRYIKPLEDVQASKQAIESDLSTLTDELASRGRDLNTQVEKRKQELKKLTEIEELKRKYYSLKSENDKSGANEQTQEIIKDEAA